MLERGPIPLYVQLADLIRHRIKQGKWQRGGILPPLQSLMAEFGVARTTVRQAIQLLAREGLLSPQRGRGTFVTGEVGGDRRLMMQTSLDDLVEMYRGDTPEVVNIAESRKQPVLKERDGSSAPDYVHMRRTHSRDGERYCVVSIFIDGRVFRMAPERFRSEVVIPLIRETPGAQITKAYQTLDISTADMEVAQDLQIPVNTPVAEIRCVFTGLDGTVLYLGESIYRSDYIHLDMDLMP